MQMDSLIVMAVFISCGAGFYFFQMYSWKHFAYRFFTFKAFAIAVASGVIFVFGLWMKNKTGTHGLQVKQGSAIEMFGIAIFMILVTINICKTNFYIGSVGSIFQLIAFPVALSICIVPALLMLPLLPFLLLIKRPGAFYSPSPQIVYRPQTWN